MLNVHTGIFDSEPKDTEPKGIVIRSQPVGLNDVYFVTELAEYPKQKEKVRLTKRHCG